jgi:uncharacterized protein involved in exopolysaccharide biosynthesis
MREQMNTPGDNGQLRDEIDIAGLLRDLWHGRWFIVATIVVSVSAASAYAFRAKEWWRSEVVLVQAESKSLPSGLSQLGGLASLAGINLGGAGGNSQTPLAVLRSREFARDFIEERGLLTVLFADRWDDIAGQWKQTDPALQPDIRDAVKFFNEKVRSVVEDKKTGLTTLSITWTDPAASAAWANELVDRINDRLRTQALEESERNIKYLQAEMASTSITALQQSIGKVLESEMQKVLLARGSREFAFKVIDRAVESKTRVRPQRAMLICLALFFGSVISVALVLIRARFLARRRPS